jgi:asparagine synthase (glutamine-hydrolysing)
MLSGGLDSSILASILRPKYSVTAGFGFDAPDFIYARRIAEKYGTKHVEVIFDQNRMAELVEQVIQVFKTFDPIEIRNSVVALAGIEKAKSDGHFVIMTGDGGDELFAGYNYLARYYSDLRKLDSELHRLWRVMHFSSKELGKHAGVEVRTPFLDEGFMSFAKSISVDEKVGEHGGEKWGKFILRKCFEPSLGDIVWRQKLAQEYGAATNKYRNYIEDMLNEQAFSSKTKAAKEQDGVVIRSKEHLHYYGIFRSYFLAPKEEGCELHCPQCSGCMAQGSRFCRICGAYPVTPKLL